ncbi:hypothetical protein D3C72_2061210 [compost metagenome]
MASGPGVRWWWQRTASSHTGSATPSVRSSASERSAWLSTAAICWAVSGWVCWASWSCSSDMAMFIESAAWPSCCTREAGQRSISRATTMHTQHTSIECVALYMRVSCADR